MAAIFYFKVPRQLALRPKPLAWFERSSMTAPSATAKNNLSGKQRLVRAWRIGFGGRPSCLWTIDRIPRSDSPAYIYKDLAHL